MVAVGEVGEVSAVMIVLALLALLAMKAYDSTKVLLVIARTKQEK